jgi:hypothetical protein
VPSARANTSAEHSDEHPRERIAGAAERSGGRAAMTSLAPVPSENDACANCGAPLVADQRYCLSCGQPTSPVRLAFLDVLESERQPRLGAGAGASTVPVAFTPYIEPAAGPAWLRRYAPLFGVLSVLLLAMIVGLLVGHWVTQSKAPATASVIKVEGNFGGLASGGSTASGGSATTPTSTTPATSTSKSSSSSTKSEEAQEEAEARAEEKAEEKAPAKAPEAKKVSSSTLSKLEKSHGKAHEKQLNEISTAPIEVK